MFYTVSCRDGNGAERTRYPCFFLRIRSGCSFPKRCRSGSEFGTAPLPPPSYLVTNSALLVFTWILAEKLPRFWVKTFLPFFLGWSSAEFWPRTRSNFWFLLLWTKCSCLLADPDWIRILKFKRWRIRISSCWIRIGSESLNLWIRPPLVSDSNFLCVNRLVIIAEFTCAHKIFGPCLGFVTSATKTNDGKIFVKSHKQVKQDTGNKFDKIKLLNLPRHSQVGRLKSWCCKVDYEMDRGKILNAYFLLRLALEQSTVPAVLVLPGKRLASKTHNRMLCRAGGL